MKTYSWNTSKFMLKTKKKCNFIYTKKSKISWHLIACSKKRKNVWNSKIEIKLSARDSTQKSQKNVSVFDKQQNYFIKLAERPSHKWEKNETKKK